MSGATIIADLIGGGLVKEVGQVIDDLTTTEEERLAAENEAQKLENQLLLGQQEINKVEAQHASTFVAGWRPYIGWIAGTSLGLVYIPKAVVMTVIWCYATFRVIAAWNGAGMPQLPPYPDLGVADLIALIFALLGMSTLRTVETVKGKARSGPLLTNIFKRSAAPAGQQEAP